MSIIELDICLILKIKFNGRIKIKMSIDEIIRVVLFIIFIIAGIISYVVYTQ